MSRGKELIHKIYNGDEPAEVHYGKICSHLQRDDYRILKVAANPTGGGKALQIAKQLDDMLCKTKGGLKFSRKGDEEWEAIKVGRGRNGHPIIYRMLTRRYRVKKR